MQESVRKTEERQKGSADTLRKPNPRGARIAQNFLYPLSMQNTHWSPDQLREPDPAQLVRRLFGLSIMLLFGRKRNRWLSVLSEVFNLSRTFVDEFKDKETRRFDPTTKERSLKALNSGFVLRLKWGMKIKHPARFCWSCGDSGRGHCHHDIDLDDSESTFGRGLPDRRCVPKCRFTRGATIRLRIPSASSSFFKLLCLLTLLLNPYPG